MHGRHNKPEVPDRFGIYAVNGHRKHWMRFAQIFAAIVFGNGALAVDTADGGHHAIQTGKISGFGLGGKLR